MGDPKRQRKKYDTPNHPWKKDRIEKENQLQRTYGLKNKREIWKALTKVRKYRKIARDIIADRSPDAKKKEEALIMKAYREGLLEKEAILDDVLALTPEAFLDRRLQTFVYKKGLARSMRQARQFIVHGHIVVGNNRVNAPSYHVKRDEEELIGFYPGSPFSKSGSPGGDSNVDNAGTEKVGDSIEAPSQQGVSE